MENLPQTNTSLAQAARLSMLNPKQKDTLKIYVWPMLTDKKIKYNSFNGSLIFFEFDSTCSVIQVWYGIWTSSNIQHDIHKPNFWISYYYM